LIHPTGCAINRALAAQRQLNSFDDAQRRCASEAQRRRYGRHTSLTCIYHYGFRFLGSYFGILILADTVSVLPLCDMEKNIMLVLLGYFLIAATVSVTASAIVGLVLTNLLVGRFTKANRPIKISGASEINEELELAKIA
jgi:hypothetical protein